MTTLPRLRIGLIGTPSQPDALWTDETVGDLVDRGFNAVQLNIAWSYRPNDEVLNLEDVVAVGGAPSPNSRGGSKQRSRRLLDICHRARLARRHGLRTILHIGAPFQSRAGFNGTVLPQCINDPDVTLRYARALQELKASAPEIDDILIYTYDQDAWLCSEFGGCDACFGKPLHERLPDFLNGLAGAWRAVGTGGRVWWEPWELSAGQTQACIEKLDADAIGLMVHSNIGEVISTQPADAFVKNIAREAERLAIPVVVEGFLSSSNEEVEPWTHLPVPLVTLDQLRAIESVDGVVGVKEYFGIRMDPFDVNLNAASEYFGDPRRSDQEILRSVAQKFGMEWLPTFWTRASEAYRLYPWDSSWFARQLGRSQPIHAPGPATVRGTQSAASEWDTPAWRSSRHAVFMRVNNSEPHAWLLEDVALRCEQAARRMTDALRSFQLENVAPVAAAVDSHLQLQRLQGIGFVTRTTAYHLHIRATLLGRLLKQRSLPALRRELAEVLRADRRNQEREIRRLRTLDALSFREGEPPHGLQAEEKWVVAPRRHLHEIDRAISLLNDSLTQYLDEYTDSRPDTAEAGQFSLTSR
ncbi:hypothetical protein [Microbacterium aurum]